MHVHLMVNWDRHKNLLNENDTTMEGYMSDFLEGYAFANLVKKIILHLWFGQPDSD